MKKKVLFLGASGLIGPHLTPGLEPYFDLRLADVKSHPQQRSILPVDITDYRQVLEAARGMDAIMNFTVVRGDPVQSFHVNVRGAWHVVKAAAALGIGKIVHSGPQSIRHVYDPHFDLGDVPRAPGSGYYGLTKALATEICRAYARTCGLQIISFVFCALGPSPTEAMHGRDFPPYTVVWEDLHQACRLALEIESVPDGFQEFDLLSFAGHGKYNVDKARRILGFHPQEHWEGYYRRTP
jgi:nucleoside-diphosphate-sugar epimerase